MYEKLYRHLLLIVKDVIEALSYIHSRGIIHNDIKGANIMIDKESTPKIIDFGISVIGPKQRRSGAPIYFSPETLISLTNYSVSDMWSLGVTLFLSATGRFPYNTHTENLKVLVYTTEPEKLNTSNKLLNKLVNKMLIKDHTKRLTTKEANLLLSNI